MEVFSFQRVLCYVQASVVLVRIWKCAPIREVSSIVTKLKFYWAVPVPNQYPGVKIVQALLQPNITDDLILRRHPSRSRTLGDRRFWSVMTTTIADKYPTWSCHR